MKKVYLFLLLFFLYYFCNSQILDRQVIGNCGNSFFSSNLWLDFTIGEMLVETNTSGDVVLNQGFHQVYIKNNYVNIPSGDLKIKVFPNPFYSFLEIEIPDEIINKSYYNLTDLLGREIIETHNSNTLITEKINLLNLSELAYGMYFLTIHIYNSKESYIFRITKL